MTYLQKSKKNKNFLNKRNILVLIVLIVFIFGSGIKSVTHFVSKPVIFVKNTSFKPFENIYNHFQFKQTLIDKNTELIKENKSLNIELLTINSLRKENQELKDLFKYQEKKPELFLSKILNTSENSPYDTFLIDSGTNQGIELGDRVSYLGIPIGTILEIYKSTAVVELYSFPHKNIPVVMVDGTFTEAKGLGAGSFLITLPKDISVNVGDLINSFDSPIGIVKDIVVDHTGTFQNVYFNYLINLKDIKFVQVDTETDNNLINQ